MLTPDEVRGTRFSQTKWREGYDQRDVDAFLDRVAATLERPGAAGALTADDVVQVRFRPTKLSAGYDQDEVDDFLDRVVASLRSTGDSPAASSASRPQVGAQGRVPVVLRVLQVGTVLLFLVGLGLEFVAQDPLGLPLMIAGALSSTAVQFLVFRAQGRPPEDTDPVVRHG